MPYWIQYHPLQAGVAAITIGIVVSAVLVTAVLVRLPADYFRRPERPPFPRLRPPLLRQVAVFAKNLLGLALVALGVVLSVPGVPGQGVLTILLGLMLLDIPGRRRWERRIVGHASVRQGIDRLRARFGRPPLEPPDTTDQPHLA